MPREYSRAQRVADQIQRDLSLYIQREMKDQRLGMVTINAVKVSTDLNYADVYFTTLGGTLTDGEEDARQSEKVLAGAAGFLRGHLAKGLKLRITPHLRFHYDHSLVRGQTMSRLIDDAVSRDRREDSTDEELD